MGYAPVKAWGGWLSHGRIGRPVNYVVRCKGDVGLGGKWEVGWGGMEMEMYYV